MEISIKISLPVAAIFVKKKLGAPQNWRQQ